MTFQVTAPVSVSKAFSPGHITGFFRKFDSQNYLECGSTGAGISIKKGVTTTVEKYDKMQAGYRISINGINSPDSLVSKFVVNKYMYFLKEPVYLNIKHQTEIPVGYGIGSSGAAALSLSFALNDVLNLKFDKFKVAQIAHEADLCCKTGLGSVLTEFFGGFEIRIFPGGPGIGKVKKIPLKNHKVILLCMSPLNTNEILSKNSLQIDGHISDSMIRRLELSGDIDEFLIMSNYFAETLNLTQGLCNQIIKKLRDQGYQSSIALFGNTVFTVVPNEEVRKVMNCLSSTEGRLIISDIDETGANVLPDDD